MQSYRQLSACFRKALTDARQKQGLTQAQLAKKLQRRQNFVSNYENGTRELRIFELLELADMLHIDPHVLFHEVIEQWKKTSSL